MEGIIRYLSDSKDSNQKFKQWGGGGGAFYYFFASNRKSKGGPRVPPSKSIKAKAEMTFLTVGMI